MKIGFQPILLAVAAVLFHSLSANAFYDARQGRWLSRDPIAEDGGFHLYAFTLNDAPNRLDRYGLQWMDPSHTPPWIEPPKPTGKPPTLFLNNTCNSRALSAAVALANKAMNAGACKKWFEQKNRNAGNLTIRCLGPCHPLCGGENGFGLNNTAFTLPGSDTITVCSAAIGDQLAFIASILIHEAAHHYCPPNILLGGESCANSAQDACLDEIARAGP